MRLRLAHISDTHFGTEVPRVVEALRRAVAALAPDVVLLSGDITQRARPAQFDAARRFMDELPTAAVRLAVPGNHDISWNPWQRLLKPYARYQRAFGAREGLWARDGVAIVLLDATDPLRQKRGALAPARLSEALARGRAACGRDGVLVVAAHQPLWTAWGEDKEQTLVGRHETARQLAEARADVVLSGHVHVPLVATSDTSDPHLPWRFLMSGAGTAVSHRVRPGAPNSFNLLDLEGPRLRLARYDCPADAFAPVAEHVFVRGAEAGWSTGTTS